MNTWLSVLYVFFLARLLIPSLAQGRNKIHMDKKWEALHRPLLTKRALELTQKHILSVLGLTEIPHTGHRQIRPHMFMLDLYKTLSRRPRSRKTKKNAARDIVNTVRGVVDQERQDRSQFDGQHQFYVFDFSAIPGNEKLVSAELRLLRRPSKPDKGYIAKQGTAFRAALYMKAPNHRAYGGGLELLDSFSFDITDSKRSWHVLDATNAVEQWKRSSKKIHFLFLKIFSLTSGQLLNPVDLGFSKEKRLHNNRALLVLFSNDGRVKPVENDSTERTSTRNESQENNSVEDLVDADVEVHSRAKRATNPAIPRAVANALNGRSRRKKNKARRRGRRKNCRLKSMYVDFQQLNWANWIIAPAGYDARLCDGECTYPIDKYLRPTNHATVQTILHSIDMTYAPKPACCVPKKLSPISMLYIEGGDNVVYKKYEDMVADRCGCS